MPKSTVKGRLHQTAFCCPRCHSTFSSFQPRNTRALYLALRSKSWRDQQMSSLCRSVVISVCPSTAYLTGQIDWSSRPFSSNDAFLAMTWPLRWRFPLHIADGCKQAFDGIDTLVSCIINLNAAWYWGKHGSWPSNPGLFRWSCHHRLLFSHWEGRYCICASYFWSTAMVWLVFQWFSDMFLPNRYQEFINSTTDYSCCQI